MTPLKATFAATRTLARRATITSEISLGWILRTSDGSYELWSQAAPASDQRNGRGSSTSSSMAATPDNCLLPLRRAGDLTAPVPKPDAIPALSRPCPCSGGRMLIIETFARVSEPNYRPATAPLVISIDTS